MLRPNIGRRNAAGRVGEGPAVVTALGVCGTRRRRPASAERRLGSAGPSLS